MWRLLLGVHVWANVMLIMFVIDWIWDGLLARWQAGGVGFTLMVSGQRMPVQYFDQGKSNQPPTGFHQPSMSSHALYT